MATYRYFRVEGQTNDLALLPPGLRDAENLAALAEEAEASVLDAYTHPCPDRCGLAVVLDAGLITERYVWLKGFAEDPIDAVPSFAAAFRREIANVMRWRAAHDVKKPNVVSESAGNPATSKAYRADAERRLPPDFGAALRPYVLDRIRWVI